MALSRTLQGTADLANATEGSHDGTLDCGTVTSGALLLVHAAGTAGVAGVTWTAPTKSSGTATIGTVTAIGTAGGGSYRATVTAWRIPVTGSGTLVLSVGDTGNSFGAHYHAIQYTGQDGTTPVAGAVTQTNPSAASLSNSTLGATPVSADEVVAVTLIESDAGSGKGVDVGTNFTERYDTSAVDSADYVNMQTATRAGSVSTSTTVVWGTDTSGGPTTYQAAAVAYIVKAGAGGTDASISASVVTATAAAIAPTVTTGVTITASVVTITAAAVAPTVSAGTNANISASVVTATGAAVTATVASGVTITASVVTTTGAAIAPSVSVINFPYPATRSGRKWLDQFGNPYVLRCMASWGMPQRLSDASITTRLEQVATRGFNAVLVMLFGYHPDGTWTAWENQAGDPVWTGTAFQSSLGSAWSTIDHILDECVRLEMTAVLVNYAAFESTGARADLEAAYTDDPQNLIDYGEALATRYANYPNIVWHVAADDSWGWGTTIADAYEAIHEGIRNIEAGTHRLVVGEPANGSSAYSQWPEVFDGTGHVRFDANGIYDWDDQAVVQIDAVINESGATSFPVWDCEPPYANNVSASGSANRQELRERIYSTYIRGCVGLNYGDEDWWPFAGSETGVMASDELLDHERAIDLLLDYVLDSTWVVGHADGGFLNSGAGTGDSKAAVGLSDNAALVYFPNSRGSIEVDTTLLTGTNNVRLRWYDPTDGTFDSIATSEAQSATRSITHPGNNAASDGDWVLVADLTGDANISASVVTATGAAVAPSLSVGVTVTASVVTATGAAVAPTAGAGVGITANVVTATGATVAPGIATGSTVTASVVTATGAAIAPTVTTDANADITASVVTATGAVIAPTVTAGSTVSASIVTATGAAIAPTVATGSTATASVVTATGAAIAPAVSAGGSVSITADVVTATGAAVAPTVSTGVTVTAVVVAATGAALAPTVGAGAGITAAVVTATATALAPTVTTGNNANITAATVTATGATIAPAIGTGSTVSASTVTATVSVIAAVVTVGIVPHVVSQAIRGRNPGTIRGRNPNTIRSS